MSVTPPGYRAGREGGAAGLGRGRAGGGAAVAAAARGERTRQGRPCLAGAVAVAGAVAMHRTAAPRPAALPRLLLSSAARALLWLGPVYLAGYLGLSGSWVLLALALWLCWGLIRRGKRERLAAALALLEDEREAVCRGLAARHLPAWVSEHRGVSDSRRAGDAAGHGGPGRRERDGERAVPERAELPRGRR